MTRIAVIGFASLDHVVQLDGTPRAGRTTTIVERCEAAWPRLGGSPAYVAAALAQAGCPGAMPVSWVGDDRMGENYRRGLEAMGVSTDAVATVTGARTPVSILAYEPAGGCVCLYDPGAVATGLDDNQRRLVAAADWLCITVGPERATRAAVDAIGPKTRLAWVVKDDPRVMPPNLAAKIAARADLICYSAAEAAFVGATLKAAPVRETCILIETRGGEGASARRGVEDVFVAARPIEVRDPTGAGDSFAGGALGALAAGANELGAVVAAGHAAAHDVLSRRIEQQSESALR